MTLNELNFYLRNFLELNCNQLNKMVSTILLYWNAIRNQLWKLVVLGKVNDSMKGEMEWNGNSSLAKTFLFMIRLIYFQNCFVLWIVFVVFWRTKIKNVAFFRLSLPISVVHSRIRLMRLLANLLAPKMIFKSGFCLEERK